MKRIICYSMLLACVFGTASCASKKAAQQSTMYPNYAGQPYYGPQPQQPYYQQPQQPQSQDPFVVQATSPVEEFAQNAPSGELRGYGQDIQPTEQLARDGARMLAVADLQMQIETFIKYAANRYNDVTTANGGTQLDAKTRQDVIQLARATVQGAVIAKSQKAYNPQTGQYKYEVCVKYDKAGVIGALEEQSQRILKNREKFLEDMQEAWDEFDRTNGRETKAEYDNRMEQQNLDRQNAREVDKINAHGQNIANIEAQRNQPANAPAIYYYAVNGNQYGPVSIHQLAAMAQSGQITIYTNIWREGLANWCPAAELPELRNLFVAAPGSVPPPPPAY